MKPIIGISIGDLNGVGPEILVKAFTDNRLIDLCTPIIFGNTKVLNFYKKNIPDCNIQFHVTNDFTKLNPKLVNVFNCWDEDVQITPGVENETGGKYAINSLLKATQCLKDGQINAIVTMPINKNNTQTKDFKYTGHTPFFKEKFGAKEVCMLLVTETLKVALLTDHVPIADIAKHVTKENIKTKVAILTNALKKDFGISMPKIALLGLNPHAGDGGLIGKEEKDIIAPAIEELQKSGAKVFGPYAADGFFARQHDTKFDAVLAMYHDQGLIPFKSFDHNQGVNYTAGLQVVRTSPDHGTAYDIAGKGTADESSFLQALYTAVDILNQRSEHQFYNANPLKRGSGQSYMKKSKSKEDVVE
jgi:4-hydroxythreonine-4-phosphate dehydrogenase